MIRLFTSAFAPPDLERGEEYADVLRRNLDCPAIDEVCVFDEGASQLPRSSSKLITRRIDHRPTYGDYFDWINEIASADDISIVANADIYFDSQLILFQRWLLPDDTVLALSRWEPTATGGSALRDRNDSQDAWIFRGTIRPVFSDFAVGTVACDNRIASELNLSGYRVMNPSFSIRSHHLHARHRGEYEGAALEGRVPPPYTYIWPHNLWPIHRTVAHNVMHRDARVAWRIDRRQWSRRLKLHWFRKGLAMLGIGRNVTA